jgi:hypothetical protein
MLQPAKFGVYSLILLILLDLHPLCGPHRAPIVNVFRKLKSLKCILETIDRMRAQGEVGFTTCP